MPPNLGISKRFKLRVNDVVVMGSDGLFDNLYLYQVLDTVNRKFNKRKYRESAQEIAKQLTVRAKQTGEKMSGTWTPFSDEVWDFHKIFYDQGKNDDTTIIVGIVAE